MAHTEVLGAEGIAGLLQPYLTSAPQLPAATFERLAAYLELLLKWNARTNLTAVREPEEIVRRHFGESLFAAQHLDLPDLALSSRLTLLDFGSGAGFPGLPIQLLRPDILVTLSESQNKKASFLREAVRTLGLHCEVWADRVEAMPPERRFDVVAMRAVDDMDRAIVSASERSASRLMILGTATHGMKIPAGFELEATVAMVQSDHRHILLLKRI